MSKRVLFQCVIFDQFLFLDRYDFERTKNMDIIPNDSCLLLILFQMLMIILVRLLIFVGSNMIQFYTQKKELEKLGFIIG